MIVIAGFIIGVVWGAFLARRRKGSALDMAQYAAGFGIAFALVAMMITIVIARMV